MEIECLACGKPLKIPQNINPDNYDGLAFCDQCNLFINVKLVKSKLIKYKVAKHKREPNIKLVFVPAKELPEEQKKLENREKELKES